MSIFESGVYSGSVLFDLRVVSTQNSVGFIGKVIMVLTAAFAKKSRIVGILMTFLFVASVGVADPVSADERGVGRTEGSSTVEVDAQATKTKTKSGKLKCGSKEQVRIYSLTQGTTTVHQFKSRGDVTNDRFKNNSYKPVSHQTFTGEREAEWKVIVTPVEGRVSLFGGAACYSG